MASCYIRVWMYHFIITHKHNSPNKEMQAFFVQINSSWRKINFFLVRPRDTENSIWVFCFFEIRFVSNVGTIILLSIETAVTLNLGFFFFWILRDNRWSLFFGIMSSAIIILCIDAKEHSTFTWFSLHTLHSRARLWIVSSKIALASIEST